MTSLSEMILEKDFNPDRYVVPVEPKEKDTRGFIYVVRDNKYPDIVKVGRTQDLIKRVKQYNVDRPFEDVEPILCTRLLSNADLIEKHIKNRLVRDHSSVGKSQEWFPVGVLQIIYDILENTYDVNYVCFDDGDY